MNSSSAVSSLALRFFQNRYLLVLGLTIIFLAGYSALSNMPRIEDPRITNRYPQIVTILPGASAERVEALVTDPIEDSLRELSEIKKITSTSRSGISIIAVELEDYIGEGENERVFSKMRNNLNDVLPELPPGASAPEFNDKTSAVAFSMVASISWQQDGTPAFSVMNRIASDLADEFRALNAGVPSCCHEIEATMLNATALVLSLNSGAD
ncbi:MAG: efflux RND transporter permease subunit, partial [Woeseiaceae bacterium]|nr:efflux RND transporter permease subunit [Woeseiaceae bacterium]